jgi:chemotaxis protein histidine kinase CheA
MPSEEAAAFIDAAREQLADISDHIAALHQDPKNEQAVIELLIAFHKIGLEAESLGYEKIAALAQRIESMLLTVRQKRMIPPPKLLNSLSVGLWRLADLLAPMVAEDIRARYRNAARNELLIAARTPFQNLKAAILEMSRYRVSEGAKARACLAAPLLIGLARAMNEGDLAATFQALPARIKAVEYPDDAGDLLYELHQLADRLL